MSKISFRGKFLKITMYALCSQSRDPNPSIKMHLKTYVTHEKPYSRLRNSAIFWVIGGNKLPGLWVFSEYPWVFFVKIDLMTSLLLNNNDVILEFFKKFLEFFPKLPWVWVFFSLSFFQKRRNSKPGLFESLSCLMDPLLPPQSSLFFILA